MATLFHSLFLLLLLLNLGAPLLVFSSDDTFSRDDFPPDFVFGSGVSAYQYEGAAFEDGRTPTIWDTYTHAGNSNGATGDIACDGYHKFKEDVQLMVDTGLEAFRFSISWARLIPNGKGPVNPKGLEYYNNLINELIIHGIQPYVTLFHVDLPQALQDEYGGWLSQKIVKDFTAYADVCFGEFGNRVSHWTTINEANAFILAGFDTGILPPQRCSSTFGNNCTGGNSSSEPYIVAHNVLLAHASVARLYKKKYQGWQHGFVGINVLAFWFAPNTNGTEDVAAAQRTNEFWVGWIVNPLVFGDYPDVMKRNVGARIPAFSELESKQVKGSFDFLGVNHYNTLYIKDNPSGLKIHDGGFMDDSASSIVHVPDDTPPGEYPIAPSGLLGVLEYFKQSYGNPPIYIHENGQQMQRNSTLNDTSRVEYMHAFIGSLLDALRTGSNTRGYFTWSFMDVFEILDGYNSGYGLYYVDLDDKDLKRYPKLSAHWYSKFLKERSISGDGAIEFEKSSFDLSQSHSS